MRRTLAYGGAFLTVLGVITLGVAVYSRAPGTTLPPMSADADIGLETTGVIFLMSGFSAFILASVRRGVQASTDGTGEPQKMEGNHSSAHPPTSDGRPEEASPERISPLEMHLLLGLRYTKNEKELSRETAVDSKVVAEKLDQLYERGYVTENSGLTEKGYDAVNQYALAQKAQTSSNIPAPQQPVIRESTIYTREVLRVPCKFCGTLIDPIQERTCPKCGARTS